MCQLLLNHCNKFTYAHRLVVAGVQSVQINYEGYGMGKKFEPVKTQI